eukprot:CAMPEP_0201568082 /NCGR_PEP_ID=MMETSP0190_2-20130828/8952_1 /ASSEMBLY_ACC=CAM_ASM_000263 /TAXON_ID=37353 /ORGANISM="Rosalina sp." /LENGTH=731 /DNA_ID=CAMNT_0047988815 /DNA_START=2270 /DNA_END=4465 /DNA_ORIENTATION=+
MNPEAFSTALLIAFDVNEEDYELGLTKIFFKPSKAAVLDTIMSQAGKPLTAEQNEKITKYIVGKRCRQLIGTLKAGMMMIKMVRMKRAARQWQQKGRVAAILGGTVMKHLFMARKQIKQRKEKEGAIMMQTYFRSMYERRHYITKIDKVKKSTKMVQIAYQSMKQRQGLQTFLDAQVEKTRADEAAKAAAAAAKPKPEPVATATVPTHEPATATATATKSIAGEPKPEVKEAEPELTREERLEIARKEAQAEADRQREEKEKEDERLRKQIEQIKDQQERNSSDAGRLSIKTTEISKEDQKRERAKKAAQNKRDRERADKDARRKLAAQKRKRRNQRYRQNPGDLTDYDTSDDDDDDDEYETDPDASDDEEEDIATLLPKFNKIAAMGQLFFRHAGARNRNKPQDRVVKISFDSHGKPKEISWGSGSRHIYFKEVLYVAKGHWTPVFDVRKDVLDKNKCFSVVSKNGKTLDLEGYSEHIAELWVKGLRKLLGQTDEKAQRMAEKNFKNLLNAAQKPKSTPADKRQINDIMRLQQDLFIMSTHTVFRNLEEERIWVIDQTIRDKFSPKQMYQVALKSDIPWRQWQQWIREKVTTYCRENNLVNMNYQTQSIGSMSNVLPNNNNNNMHNPSVSMANVFQPMPQQQQPQHQQSISMFNVHPSQKPSYHGYQPPQQQAGYYRGNSNGNNGLHNFNVNGNNGVGVNNYNQQSAQQTAQAPQTNGDNYAEEEKCTLM